MIKAVKFTRTGVIISVQMHKRMFSKSAILMVDSNDGRNLDNTQEIADSVKGDKKAFEKYFEEKEKSIVRDYRTDSNSAAASGVPAKELQDWLQDHKDMLAELKGQMDDVHDLADIVTTPVQEEPVQDSSDTMDFFGE